MLRNNKWKDGVIFDHESLHMLTKKRLIFKCWSSKILNPKGPCDHRARNIVINNYDFSGKVKYYFACDNHIARPWDRIQPNWKQA